eukprot:scaffold4216_cov145-Isochrysis_galbana.AAC.5
MLHHRAHGLHTKHRRRPRLGSAAPAGSPAPTGRSAPTGRKASSTSTPSPPDPLLSACAALEPTSGPTCTGFISCTPPPTGQESLSSDCAHPAPMRPTRSPFSPSPGASASKPAVLGASAAGTAGGVRLA